MKLYFNNEKEKCYPIMMVWKEFLTVFLSGREK